MTIETSAFAGDLHIHTGGHDAIQHTPERMIQAAKQKGLKFIAVTNHNSIRDVEKTSSLAEQAEIILLEGVETSTSDGHAVILGKGVTKTFNRYRSFLVRKPFRKTARRFRELGDFLIVAAHPKPRKNLFSHSLSYKQVQELARDGLLDALETTIDGTEIPELKTLARTTGLSVIGSSDSHRAEDVGNGRTELDTVYRTQKEIIDAIRNGRSRAIGMKEGAQQRMGRFLRMRRSLINKWT